MLRLSVRHVLTLTLLIQPSMGWAESAVEDQNDPLPNLDVLSQLIRLGDETGEALSISKAMSMALEDNYLGRISGEDVVAARAGMDQTRGFLLPRLEAGATYERFDNNRSTVRRGTSPRSQSSVDLRATQMIYEDGRITNFRQSRRELDLARESNAAVRLSIVEEAAIAYIDVLSIQSSLRIAEDNLRITDKNLQLAKIRREVGTAGPEEVLRFQSEQAQQKSNLWTARNRLNAAINRLNITLGLEPGRRWHFEDLRLSSPEFATLLNEWSQRIRTAEDANEFRLNSVRYALRTAPEIAALRASLEIQQMELDQNRRSFFVPDISASFLFRHILDSEYGASALDGNDERNSWTFLLGATLPLFEGGTRYGDIRLSRSELRRIEWQEALIRQEIATRVEDALSAMASSYLSIHLSRHAAKSADKNLTIVQDKYEQGSVTIIDLLDAQNNAVIQRQNASISLYNFFRDLMQYQRQLGWIEPLSDEPSRIEFIKNFTN